jgi:Flp pilus assembly protein TadD
LLVVLVAAATFTRYGVVDLSPYLPLEAVGIRAPGQSAGTADSKVPEAAGAENPEKVYNKAIGLARRSIRAKRFSKAALEYNRALSARPDSLEALDGLAKAYNGLGDRGRAEAVLEKVRSIKGK